MVELRVLKGCVNHNAPDFETFLLPIGMIIAFTNRAALWGTVLQRVGPLCFETKHKEKDMRELSTEELDVVVGGNPITVEF